jgi:hypothetical protein
MPCGLVHDIKLKFRGKDKQRKISVLLHSLEGLINQREVWLGDEREPAIHTTMIIMQRR